MSGGYFGWKQFELQKMADAIEQIALDNAKEDWDEKYSAETVDELHEAIRLLRRAYIYVQRIDWLCSSDDTEIDFHKRLHQQLKEQDV
jgi:hypothetical protein